MESGNVVEFIDSQKIVCAVILEVKRMRLRLLTENNRETKLSVNRLSHKCNHHLDLNMGRDRLVNTLKKISKRRKALIKEIDIKELWEVLNTEQEWIDLATMTEFCFPEDPNGDHEAAVMRAFFENRLYFKFNTDKFFPNSTDKVNQLIAQEAEITRKNNIIIKGAIALKTILAGKNSQKKEELEDIIDILCSYYLFEKESNYYELGKAIVEKAGVDSNDVIFKMMVHLGIWEENQNFDLLRFDVPTNFSSLVNTTAENCISRISDKLFLNRKDLTDLSSITIDGQSTLDFDDALSIEDHGNYYVVGIHIADVGHYIDKKDPIDQEALGRGSSIYMPDQKISMVPACLSDDLCSLRQGQLRPAISTMVKITSGAKILGYEIFASVIKVKHQLTYYDVNAIADYDPAICAFTEIAHNFRQKRLSNGALQITLPEINIWLSEDGEPNITRVNRESPGRLLVSEMMILANWLMARYLTEHNVPAIFRSQPDPRERLITKDEGTLFQNWMQRKHLSRFILSSKPDNHSGLGLDAYVTATSPIRKYFDLATQRQIRSILNLEKSYSKEEIEKIIHMLQLPMSHVGRIQYRRNRYWLLKYLEGKIGQKEEAIVLGRRRNTYQILIKEYLIECSLPLQSGYNLKPEDLIQITIQHVNARRDILVVFMS
jgi:exoribonuclease-2